MTFLIGGGTSGAGSAFGRHGPRRTILVRRSGATMNGAIQATIRIGTRKRVPAGRTASANPRIHRIRAYDPIVRDDRPANCSRRAGQQHEERDQQGETEQDGSGEHGSMVRGRAPEARV